MTIERHVVPNIWIRRFPFLYGCNPRMGRVDGPLLVTRMSIGNAVTAKPATSFAKHHVTGSMKLLSRRITWKGDIVVFWFKLA
jgi:hypothetical protein